MFNFLFDLNWTNSCFVTFASKKSLPEILFCLYPSSIFVILVINTNYCNVKHRDYHQHDIVKDCRTGNIISSLSQQGITHHSTVIFAILKKDLEMQRTLVCFVGNPHCLKETGQWPQIFCFVRFEASPLLWDYCKARRIFVTSDCLIEYIPSGWQTSKKYWENIQLLFFYFLLNGRKIHAELLIEILVPTQIVCWSQEKSLSSSHKYFLLQIFGNFKQINPSIGLLENCLSNLLIFFRIHLRSWKEIFN